MTRLKCCKNFSSVGTICCIQGCLADQFEPRHEKTGFCICENKEADQLLGYSAFVFATRIVQSLYFLNQKFQAFSHIQ